MTKDLRRLPTPDEVSSLEYKQVLITVPSNADTDRFLWGAVLSLAFWTSWDEAGTMTKEEAARIFKDILASRMEFSMLGVIVPIYVEDIPPTMLLCDGSTHAKDDYPQLYEVLPIGAKGMSDFTLPDLRERFLLGASASYPEADTGGSFDITLTELEMPAHTHTTIPHTHTDGAAAPSVAGIGIDAPVPSAVPTAGITSPETVIVNSSGGGQAHDNTPPYFAVRYAMIAKVQP